MRKALLPLLLLTSTLFALKISRDKTDFTFIQLPQKPLPKEVTTCQTEVTTMFTPTFDKMQKAYREGVNTREKKYQSDLKQWEIDKRIKQKEHDRAVIAYKKNSAGKSKPVLSLPSKPQRPFIPPAPYLLVNYNKAEIAGTVGTLNGYATSGSPHAKLTVQLNGFEYLEPKLEKNKRTKKNKEGGTHTYYTYRYIIQYRHPVTVQASYNGKVFGTKTPSNFNRLSKKNTNEFSTEYELQKWWKAKRATYLKKLDDALLKENLKIIKTVANRTFGFPEMQRKTVVRVPSDKRQKYDDYVEAKKHADAAYRSLRDDRSRSEAKKQFAKANALWMKALEETKPNEKSTKKARITGEVTGATYLNLIEAAIFSHDYSRAEQLIKTMLSLKLKGKDERKAKDLQKFLKDQKERYEANL